MDLTSVSRGLGPGAADGGVLVWMWHRSFSAIVLLHLGHDRKAESMLAKLRYGSLAEHGLAAHGWGQ